MKETKITCDKCGKSEIATCGSSSIEVWTHVNYTKNYKDVGLDFCPDCSKKLDVDVIKKEKSSNKTIGDKLVEIIFDIASEAAAKGR